MPPRSPVQAAMVYLKGKISSIQNFDFTLIDNLIFCSIID
ncbi:hypothetical protein M084_1865 [Bacteroides fragilis str. 3988 T1]|nr:hypothetical protein M084_1865 [Bacteroides fragilis str. 3988 T1]